MSCANQYQALPLRFYFSSGRGESLGTSAHRHTKSYVKHTICDPLPHSVDVQQLPTSFLPRITGTVFSYYFWFLTGVVVVFCFYYDIITYPQMCIQERGCVTETNYSYSIISPLVAECNQQKGGGGRNFE